MNEGQHKTVAVFWRPKEYLELPRAIELRGYIAGYLRDAIMHCELNAQVEGTSPNLFAACLVRQFVNHHGARAAMLVPLRPFGIVSPEGGMVRQQATWTYSFNVLLLPDYY